MRTSPRCARRGFADTVAIASLTAQFLFINFMNNIARTERDFPADPPSPEIGLGH
jgi:hypothetical protein